MDCFSDFDFGNVSEHFRTDGRKCFGQTTDGQTEIFRPVGWPGEIFPQSTPGRTDENGLPAGQPDARPARHPDGRTDGRTKKKRKNQSVSQTIDLIMTIKTSTGSSKTELSSRGKRPFKVRRSGANYGPCPSANFKHFDFCLMLEVSKLQASRMQNA